MTNLNHVRGIRIMGNGLFNSVIIKKFSEGGWYFPTSHVHPLQNDEVEEALGLVSQCIDVLRDDYDDITIIVAPSDFIQEKLGDVGIKDDGHEDDSKSSLPDHLEELSRLQEDSTTIEDLKKRVHNNEVNIQGWKRYSTVEFEDHWNRITELEIDFNDLYSEITDMKEELRKGQIDKLIYRFGNM